MSEKLLRAINVAAWVHDGQVRKGTEIPYVSHAYGVMHLVSQQPAVREDVMIAALLHDVLEDVPERYNAAMMEADFGDEVLELVRRLTKDSSLSTWKMRADDYLSRIPDAPLAMLYIAASDKVHNLSSILNDYEVHGESVWDRFNSSKEEQVWWYGEVYRAIYRRLDELGVVRVPIMDRYGELIIQLHKTLS